jgi:hypothetical protein
MSCKNCGKSDNPDQSNFCNRCGLDLERVSGCVQDKISCDHSNNPDQSHFCNRCGVSVQRLGECSICLQDNLLLKPLSCGHSFCQSYCYSRCSKKCPLCRKTNTFLDDSVDLSVYIDGCSRCNCTELVQKNFHLKCTNCSHEFMDRDVKKINIHDRPAVLSRDLFPVKHMFKCSKCSWITLSQNIDSTKCKGCKVSLSSANTQILQ